MRGALTWREWWPSVRTGVWVVALFALALALVRTWQAPLRELLAAHAVAGAVLFVATSVTAVLMPVATNLPLVPLAVLAWGPWTTAAMLLAGWLAGAALSFTLGRQLRAAIVRRFPSVARHAQIDRLIDPRHRLRSLVLLRMTFPVDVLSYALGLFSPRTTLTDVVWSTALGAAPFALLFAWLPTLSPGAQVTVFVASTLAFAAYAWWMLERPRRG